MLKLQILKMDKKISPGLGAVAPGMYIIIPFFVCLFCFLQIKELSPEKLKVKNLICEK